MKNGYNNNKNNRIHIHQRMIKKHTLRITFYQILDF